MKMEKGKTVKVDLPIETKDLGERSVQFTISKEVIDRDGDILRAGGVDFENYMKNPVFLPFHNSRDFPLGKVTKFWVEGNSVKAIVYFPKLEELSSDPKLASEKAKLVDFCYFCYKTGMLNAVSVGFIPIEWEERKENGEVIGFDVLKWELLEFSAVAVPANQDAIAEAVKSFGEDFTKSFIVGEKTILEKSGKKISAETRAVLDKIKDSCGRIEKLEKELKECRKELLDNLKELDDEVPDVPDNDGCGDDDEKGLDIVYSKMVELPDL